MAEFISQPVSYTHLDVYKRQAQYEAFVNYMVDPTNGMRQHFIDTGFDHTGMAADKIRDREEKPIRRCV